MARVRIKDKEPVIAGVVTCLIGFLFIAVGSINTVAEIIAMFFMVTYGAICLVSFLEHLAADPAYRPSFKSKWYISLLGAVLCFWLMFQMKPTYAFISLSLMAGFYLLVSYSSETPSGLANIFKGLIFQVSRQLQVFLQKKDHDKDNETWRPSVVCISENSFERFAAFDLLRWIAQKYGFGTYIHLLEGYLSKATHRESRQILDRLIKLAENSHSNVFLDTIISPSYTSAIAQVMQLPGVSGKDNNMIMFEFPKKDPTSLDNIVDNYNLINAAGFDVCILGSSDRGFGYTKELHIWITSRDYENANLMILLGYIILGHKDWRRGDIKLFAVYPEHEAEERRLELLSLIKDGRLPISKVNVNLINSSAGADIKNIINEKSVDADLTIVGFRSELLKRQSIDLFTGFDKVGNILFVNTTSEKEIS